MKTKQDIYNEFREKTIYSICGKFLKFLGFVNGLSLLALLSCLLLIIWFDWKLVRDIALTSLAALLMSTFLWHQTKRIVGEEVDKKFKCLYK